MGKANHPYARSVQQKHALPQNMLPDAGLVFDTLLKREKVQAPIVILSSHAGFDVHGFSSSDTLPDYLALCSRSRRLSFTRELYCGLHVWLKLRLH